MGRVRQGAGRGGTVVEKGGGGGDVTGQGGGGAVRLGVLEGRKREG